MKYLNNLVRPLTLLVLMLSLCSCGIFKTKAITPKEPQHVEWGDIGQQPTQVYQNYRWICVDSDRYYVIAK